MFTLQLPEADSFGHLPVGTFYERERDMQVGNSYASPDLATDLLELCVIVFLTSKSQMVLSLLYLLFSVSQHRFS